MINTVTINTPTELTLRVLDMRPGMVFAIVGRLHATPLMCVTGPVGGFQFVNLETGASSPMEATLPVRRIYRVTVESDDG